MTYNVFGGTLNLTQSINQSPSPKIRLGSGERCKLPQWSLAAKAIPIVMSQENLPGTSDFAYFSCDENVHLSQKNKGDDDDNESTRNDSHFRRTSGACPMPMVPLVSRG